MEDKRGERKYTTSDFEIRCLFSTIAWFYWTGISRNAFDKRYHVLLHDQLRKRTPVSRSLYNRVDLVFRLCYASMNVELVKKVKKRRHRWRISVFLFMASFVISSWHFNHLTLNIFSYSKLSPLKNNFDRGYGKKYSSF